MGTKSTSWKKKFFKFILLLVLLGVGVIIVYFYIPYGDSNVKAGQLNYVTHKGIIFKTYEGKLIQTGIKSATTGGVQSNEFKFSIENKQLAMKLMELTGQNVKIHYKEYYGALPWRGYTRFVVDSIIAVEPIEKENELTPNNIPSEAYINF